MTTPPANKRKEAVCADWLSTLTAEEIRDRISRRPGHTGRDSFFRHELRWIEEHRPGTLREHHVVVEHHDVTAATAPKEEAPPNGADTSETACEGATDAAGEALIYPEVGERIYPEPPAPAPDPLAELRAIAADLAARSAAGALTAQEVTRFKARLMRGGVQLEALGWTIHGPRGEWRRLG